MTQPAESLSLAAHAGVAQGDMRSASMPEPTSTASRLVDMFRPPAGSSRHSGSVDAKGASSAHHAGAAYVVRLANAAATSEGTVRSGTTLERRPSGSKSNTSGNTGKRRGGKLVNMVLNKKDVKGAVEDTFPMYSGNGEDYKLGDTIGFGATSVVRLATYTPLGQLVAVKVMQLEQGRDSITSMQREVQLMSLSKHPNILRVRGDWCSGEKLYIATRFIPNGSLLDIMEHSFRDGLDEVTCATILSQAAEGLHYLHINGWLHRDVKAGNLLVDVDGTVLISDFGCSSQIYSDEGGFAAHEDMVVTRKSFVGTPCWMAPEVVEQRPYDSKADIWSFGITAIEIATGRAPHSLYTPAQILLKTVAERPPTLDIEGHAHPFSKQFKGMIDACLKKDANIRPTAEKLLEHSFFKQAKRKQHLVGALLMGLPPLTERQSRRARSSSRMSLGRINSQSVWDFETSPVIDQFSGFSMSNPNRTPAITPTHSRFPSREPDHASPGSPRSSSGGQSRRQPSNTGGHRRGISFDALTEQPYEDEDGPPSPRATAADIIEQPEK